MTRRELIEILIKDYGFDKIEADFAVRIMLDTLSSLLAKGNRIELRGFGSFDILTRTARKARNPKSGSTIQAPERRFVHFRAGKKVKKLIADQYGLEVRT